ncbi:hypothetical protein AGRA3207_000729 [Actinomadura graeca]|uniref:DUF2946 domain-containing protein n=1 Tax=Actinomadura graeca TaxID=2750812 RepID=A0ABX8QMZ7_9ACTN|nr:hypothetical protein [Actinomadura graeca]QXJ20083.1 hypothetical protein AGRA3207_000729 [Actinomadura graeca]
MSGTTSRRRHGLAGLLVGLFVVAGLVFSYGLGHAPPPRVCTEHAVTVPVGAALADHGPHGTVPKPADAVMDAPPPLPPQGPSDACLCLAVLFTLMVFALLAAGLGRPLLRVPARASWTAALPRGALPVLASPPTLQVLRL